MTLYISKHGALRAGHALISNGKAKGFHVRERFQRNADGSADRGYEVVAFKGRPPRHLNH